jgi:hypothetical protein
MLCDSISDNGKIDVMNLTHECVRPLPVAVILRTESAVVQCNSDDNMDLDDDDFELGHRSRAAGALLSLAVLLLLSAVRQGTFLRSAVDSFCFLHWVTCSTDQYIVEWVFKDSYSHSAHNLN